MVCEDCKRLVVHFDTSGDILVEVFRNKLAVSNPGGLVRWLKKEDFGKLSRTRNPLIADLLSKTGYVERLGTGINRVRNSMAGGDCLSLNTSSTDRSWLRCMTGHS